MIKFIWNVHVKYLCIYISEIKNLMYCYKISSVIYKFLNIKLIYKMKQKFLAAQYRIFQSRILIIVLNQHAH